MSFDVERGEIFGVLGRNGAGKTTTVELHQGLRRADSGAIRVLGLDPTTQAAPLRQRIGSQLQDSVLPGRLRAAGAVQLFAAFALHPHRARLFPIGAGIGVLLVFPLRLISGTARPCAVLPSGLRDVGAALPRGRLVTAVRDAWFGFSWIVADLAVLARYAPVAGALSLWFFHWD